MKNLKIYLSITLSLLICLYSQLSYGTIRYSGSGGNFNIDLGAVNSVVSNNASLGSNYEKYYLIAPPNQKGLIVDQTNAQATGLVYCKANYLLGDYDSGLRPDDAYHRLYSYMPYAGFDIDGLKAYKINSNTFFTLYSDKGIVENWQSFYAYSCSSQDQPMNTAKTSSFIYQFPFEIRVYVKKIPIDGKVIIQGGVIAGYSRVFQDGGYLDITYIPQEKATILLNLSNTVINYKSNCQSTINNLNINHQSLNSFDFDNTEVRTVTYQCERYESVKVRFTLDYTSDGDPENRLPLKYGGNTIYSELMLYDTESNQRGKSIETTINKIKYIQIESHISGKDFEPGKYTGNAWLIANYL